MLWGALTNRVRQSGSSPPVVRGWMTYCGKFYRTDLGSMLRRINAYRMRQARREFRRLRSHKRAWR